MSNKMHFWLVFYANPRRCIITDANYFYKSDFVGILFKKNTHRCKCFIGLLNIIAVWNVNSMLLDLCYYNLVFISVHLFSVIYIWLDISRYSMCLQTAFVIYLMQFNSPFLFGIRSGGEWFWKCLSFFWNCLHF